MPLSLVMPIIGAALSCGCQLTRVREPLAAGWADVDPHAQSEFWYQLVRRPVMGNDELCHALMLYVDGTDRHKTYADRVRDLQSRKMLPADFSGLANAAADRGTLAYALVRMLKIDGGITMRLFGDTPRYATRALEYRGVYPACSPNQAMTGAQFVGIMQKAEEYEHGNPANLPAHKLPSEIPARSALASAFQGASEKPRETIEDAPHAAIYLDVDPSDADAVAAMFLADGVTTAPANVPATAPIAGARKLTVIITKVEGDFAEVREDASKSVTWVKAHASMVLHENAELRTGPKSAIRFIIPPSQTFCLDSQGYVKIMEAATLGSKVKTDMGLSHGRLRFDLDKGGANTPEPVRIEQSGIEHDATIRSPNSALVLRGTRVSLFEQAGFDPEATSLTGVATYINTRGQRVAFGGNQVASIRGGQTSAAQQASDRATAQQLAILGQQDFATREISIVIQRGGFIIGDVVVGNLHLSDFPKLPGALDFVLQWTGTKASPLNDLNLAVFSPLDPRANPKLVGNPPDFVANPPFTISLTPNSPSSILARATSYPEKSRSGGSISKNSIGPDGLELASWPASYPVGKYVIHVFNFIDAKTPPSTVTNPVTYTLDIFLNGQKLTNTYTGKVGFLQTSPMLTFSVPASVAPQKLASPQKPIRQPVQRRPNARR